jgi:hypothetical protein
MKYINNQYLKLDISLKEMAKIEIMIDDKNKLIEELEIEDEFNIIIAYSKKVDYKKIRNIKILITDEEALIKNKYIIPEFIENIIVYGSVYVNNKMDIERLRNSLEIFNIIYRNEEKAIEIIERGNININQINKEKITAIVIACKYNKKLIALKLVKKPEINLYLINNLGYATLLKSWIDYDELNK